MAEYTMTHKTGKDVIHKTTQETLEQAIKYFSELKQLPEEEFNKLFTVIKIK